MQHTNPKVGNLLELMAGLERARPALSYLLWHRIGGIEEHIQGIARHGNRVFVSQNSTPAIDIYDARTRRYLRSVRIDTHLRHYGGCQQVGDYLVVTVEGRHESDGSIIGFVDLTTLREVAELRIRRPGRKAGGVGMACRTRAGRDLHCLAVMDNDVIDFYTSESGPADGGWRFTLASGHGGFDIREVSGLGGYSETCLVTDEAGEVFLVGFRTTGLPTMNFDHRQVRHSRWKSRGDSGHTFKDMIDIYHVDLDAGGVGCTLVKSLWVRTRGLPGGPFGVHFRYAGGLRVVSPESIQVLGAARHSVFRAVSVNTLDPSRSGRWARSVSGVIRGWARG